MRPWMLAIGVTVAVKNGPPDMWRSFSTHPRPLGPVIASPLWLAGTILLLLTLAPSGYRGMKGIGLAPRLAGLLTAGAVGLLVALDLLAQRTLLPLLVFVVVLAAPFVVLGARLYRSSKPARPNEVVDLRRYREDMEARRRVGWR